MSLKEKFDNLVGRDSKFGTAMAVINYPSRWVADKLLLTFNSAESNERINKVHEAEGTSKIGEAKVFSLD